MVGVDGKTSGKAERTGKETLTDMTETETGTQKARIKKEYGNGIENGIENGTDPEAAETTESRETMQTVELGIEVEKGIEAVIGNDEGQRIGKVVGGRTERRKVVSIKDGTEKLSENDPRSENLEQQDTETAPPYPINKSASKATAALGNPAMSSQKKTTRQKKKRKLTSATLVSSLPPPTPSIPSSSSTLNQSIPAIPLHIRDGDYSRLKTRRLSIHH